MGKKKTVFLHIGTPKTGTTSIQTYLADNYDKLFEDGCLVPKTSRRHRPNHTLLSNYCTKRNFVTAMSIRNGIYTRKELKQFRRDFYQNFREEIRSFDGDTVVMSSEQCYEALRTEKELEKFKALFDGVDCQIKIVVYIREQADMLCSFYSTKMKQGKTYLIDTIEEFERKNLFNYNHRLKVWEEVFGIENIVLRVFDRRSLVGNDIVSDFCHVTQLPKYECENLVTNRSLNAKQCEYLRRANVHIPLFKDGRMNKNRAGLVKMIANTRIESPGVTDWISRSYQSVYDEQNEELRKRYFQGSEPLFRKKELNDQAKDQVGMLSRNDEIMITEQIIEKNKERREIICKCLAAIFDIDYENEKISMSYVKKHQGDGGDGVPVIKQSRLLKIANRVILKLARTFSN